MTTKNELLVESIGAGEGNILTESVKTATGSDVFLKGVFMQAEVQNRNKRIYPLTEMVSAVALAQDQITTHGGIFGELDHPAGLTINMANISHVITELYMDGNNAIGKCKLLNTPMGLIAKELVNNSGARFGVSSRGMGRVNESTNQVDGFVLVTIDLVATPSAQGAMPLPVYESLMDTLKGRKVLDLAESVRLDQNAQESFQKAFKQFFDGLRTK